MSPRGLLLLLVAIGAGNVTFAGQPPAEKCRAGKNLEAGVYANCRQQAESRYVLSGNAAAQAKARSSCQGTFAQRWAKLEQRAARAGATCPIPVDAVRPVLEACTDAIASVLGGAKPPAPCATRLQGCRADLAACRAAPVSVAGRRLETGQTECYGAGGTIPCAGTGQDGDVRAGLARAYADNGDGTISDLRTGLMWEKLSDDGGIHDRDQGYSWADAVAVKVAALNAESFAGRTDWRLPNVNELLTLVDYGTRVPATSAVFAQGCAPGCTVLTCSCTADFSTYWSSNAFLGSAWHVGLGGSGALTADDQSAPLNVRAVRGP